VDQALCFGWIDGVMRRIDEERHMQRSRLAGPGATGATSPPVWGAFEARSEKRSGIGAELPPDSDALGGERQEGGDP
jgi:hypothetical protein